MKTGFLLAILFLATLIVTDGFSQANKNDPKQTLEAFIKAQNQHDLSAVKNLLFDSPNFLWITKGVAIWGREAALSRFEVLYKGTWMLQPDYEKLKMTELDKKTIQIFVPITFSIGDAGQNAKNINFLMNMVLIKKNKTWVVSSLLPIPSANP